MVRWLSLTLLLVGCGSKASTGATERPAPGAVDAPGPGDAAPAPDAAPPPPAPDAAPAGGACRAPAGHCCTPDGSIVKATCDPLDNGPSRNRDGTCGPCTLRCLPGSARIATPEGERELATLRAGEPVWTLDAAGARVVRPILEVRRRDAPATHTVLRVSLADGRRLVGSPGHPLADGRRLDGLVPGALVDGVRVLGVAAGPLGADATWDLLPAGDSGSYWADGVLLGSTLAGRP